MVSCIEGIKSIIKAAESLCLKQNCIFILQNSPLLCWSIFLEPLSIIHPAMQFLVTSLENPNYLNIAMVFIVIGCLRESLFSSISIACQPNQLMSLL